MSWLACAASPGPFQRASQQGAIRTTGAHHASKHTCIEISYVVLRYPGMVVKWIDTAAPNMHPSGMPLSLTSLLPRVTWLGCPAGLSTLRLGVNKLTGTVPASIISVSLQVGPSSRLLLHGMLRAEAGPCRLHGRRTAAAHHHQGVHGRPRPRAASETTCAPQFLELSHTRCLAPWMRSPRPRPLVELRLVNNSFSGTVPEAILSSLQVGHGAVANAHQTSAGVTCSFVQVLVVSSNSLTGSHAAHPLPQPNQILGQQQPLPVGPPSEGCLLAPLP